MNNNSKFNTSIISVNFIYTKHNNNIHVFYVYKNFMQQYVVNKHAFEMQNVHM